MTCHVCSRVMPVVETRDVGGVLELLNALGGLVGRSRVSPLTCVTWCCACEEPS